MMLVTLKTLKQQTFQIEIDPEETVKALKLKIEVKNGKDFAANNQRLIYAGKILLDDNKLCTYNLDENKFIVMMVTKPKSSYNQQSLSTSAPETRESASTTKSGDDKNKTPDKKPKPQPVTEPKHAPKPPVTANEPDFEEQNIMDMGYNKQQVEQALHVSLKNQERAVEYLITGIPDDLLLKQREKVTEADFAADEDPLDFLRDHPQFQRLRAEIQQDPNLLNTLLQQIAQSDPELLQILSRHKQAFIRIFNEPVTALVAGAVAEEVVARVNLDPQQPQKMVEVSLQDMEAIERLKALEFPEGMKMLMSYNSMVELENRQEKLLTNLVDLYDRIKLISTLCKFKRQEELLAAENNNDYVKPNEVVMFLSPDKLPWFLNIFLKKVNGLNVTWHIHSSVPNIKIAKIEAYFNQFQSLYKCQSGGKVNFRLIFKCVSATPELKISSLSAPIIGSVNILRYLCSIFPNVVNYDYENFQIDGLLDNCHLLEIESVKNKEVIITEMFTNAKDFVYDNAFSVVDLAVFNVIKQLQAGIKQVPKTWYNECENFFL